MKEPKQLQIGKHCFVCRPEGTFAGVVIDIQKDRVLVFGKGSIFGTTYREWFPIKCKMLTVEPA